MKPPKIVTVLTCISTIYAGGVALAAPKSSWIHDEIRRFEVSVQQHPNQAVSTEDESEMIRLLHQNQRDVLRGISQRQKIKGIMLWAFALPGGSEQGTTVQLAENQMPPADSVWVTVKRGLKEWDWAIRNLGGHSYRFLKRLKMSGLEVQLDPSNFRALNVKSSRLQGRLELSNEQAGDILEFAFEDGGLAVRTSEGMQYVFAMDFEGGKISFNPISLRRKVLDMRKFLVETRDFQESDCSGDLSF